MTIKINGSEYEIADTSGAFEVGDILMLKKVKEVKEEKKWRLSTGGKYFFIDSVEGVVERMFKGNYQDSALHYIGNYYQTKAQAQAVIDLKKDIFRFEMPSGECFRLCCEPVGYIWEHKRFYGLADTANILAGTILPITATKEDRERRIELLEKVHNATQ